MLNKIRNFQVKDTKRMGVKKATTPINAKCTFGGTPTPTPTTAYARPGARNSRSAPKTPVGAPGHISNCKALKNIDSKLKNIILDEVVSDKPGITWNDIAGLDNAKQTLQEIGLFKFRLKILLFAKRPIILFLNSLVSLSNY